MTDEQIGTARVVDGQSRPVLDTSGPCLQSTLVNLEAGVVGKPLPRAALDSARSQAAELLDAVLRFYASDVAVGEVGVGGTGLASSAPPLAKECPTGLLYGRIQSGKTNAMITLTAMALDNGFRVAVVLTSDNVKLVEQTADRFRVLEGPLIKSSTESDRWEADIEHVRRELPTCGLVIICQKNTNLLDRLIRFLEAIASPDYPALILDDEADQATPDTTQNARSSGRANAPKQGSTISRLAMRNDAADEIGRSVREKLRHNVFVQVTATPYALLLQNLDSPSRPAFTTLLEPGSGYTGGEQFFSEDHVGSVATPPLVFVAEEESDQLEKGVKDAPRGLRDAISFFLVSAAAQTIKDPTTAARGQNFLCHTSQRTAEHEKLGNLIRSHVAMVSEALKLAELGGEVAIHLQQAYDELKRTLPDAPPFDAIVRTLRVKVPRREVIVVNSTGSNAEFGRSLNFIVGGNILGRGLTIENLLVTYYLRRAKVTQMDTMLQHARMFGYRQPLMPHTRVYLPQRLAIRFHRIHVAERTLRDLLSDPERRGRVVVQVSDGLRATRPSVLDMGSIGAYPPGAHIYPDGPLVAGPQARREQEKADAVVLPLLGGAFTTYNGDNLREVALDDIIDVLPKLPYADDDWTSWEPKAMQNMLDSMRQRFQNKAYIYCRTMQRSNPTATGALGGPVLKELRTKRRPVLCLFRDDGHKYKPPGGQVPCDFDFWYPSLVLPDDDDMPVHVFNMND